MANANADLQNSMLSGRADLMPGVTKPIGAYNYAIFQNIGSMRDYLLAEGYSATALNRMTKNDLVYACKKAGALTATEPPPEEE